METILMLLFLILIIVLMGIIVIFSYNMEKRAWNSGISPENEEWRYFDTDSQGGRGYIDSKNNVVWISWSVIDRK